MNISANLPLIPSIAENQELSSGDKSIWFRIYSSLYPVEHFNELLDKFLFN